MVYSTKQLLEKGETEYSIRKKVLNKEIFLVERGIYSDKENIFIDEAYISTKYPNAVITGLSAFYIYNLTDHIPDYFFIATEQHSFPIKRKDIKQSYQHESFFQIGIVEMETDTGIVRIYDLERLLIELFRLKEKYASEIYYEVLAEFRKKKEIIDFYKVNEYCKHFINGGSLLSKIKETI